MFFYAYRHNASVRIWRILGILWVVLPQRHRTFSALQYRQGHQVLEVDTQGDGQGGFDSRMMRWGRCVVVGGMWGLFGKVDKMMLVLVHLTEYR